MKKEFSQKLVVAVVIFACLCVAAYYIAIFAGKACDSAIGVTALGTIVGGVLSYLLYQLGLKNSRNRYGIDTDGQPFRTKIEEEENDD